MDFGEVAAPYEALYYKFLFQIEENYRCLQGLDPFSFDAVFFRVELNLRMLSHEDESVQVVSIEIFQSVALEPAVLDLKALDPFLTI